MLPVLGHVFVLQSLDALLLILELALNDLLLRMLEDDSVKLDDRLLLRDATLVFLIWSRFREVVSKQHQCLVLFSLRRIPGAKRLQGRRNSPDHCARNHDDKDVCLVEVDVELTEGHP